jgi:ribonucleotide reductase beta subunit family protein with ferritin-like domain/putative sterol carrier protein
MSVANADKTKNVAEITYEDLYKRWEKNNWSAYDIDFSQDRIGWDSLSDIQRKSALWIYSMFFYGEDAVTDGLSPYIDAAPTEEMKYFLATQQVDEARHSVFFHRFFKEVIGAGDSVSDALEFTHEHLNWGYRGIFGRLETMFDELRADKSTVNFARAIALYHLIIESTLAQPGQHFIEDFFHKAGSMPGFSEGMENVSRDEQRHIGFGVKVLAELVNGPEGEEVKDGIADIMRECMPYAVGVFTPPGWDREYTRCYGFEVEDIYTFGMRSVEMKWKMIGYPLDEMPGVYPFPMDIPHRTRAERQIVMLQSGLIGAPVELNVTPEAQEYYFDVVAATADSSAVDKPMTVQWKFSDADDYYVRIDNGSTAAHKGIADKANVTLRTSIEDWVEISRGSSPRSAMLRGKLRMTGAPWNLLRMEKIWPSRAAADDKTLVGAGNRG